MYNLLWVLQISESFEGKCVQSRFYLRPADTAMFSVLVYFADVHSKFSLTILDLDEISHGRGVHTYEHIT